MRQKTIRKEGYLKGIGIHCGTESTVVFKPAGTGEGIRFFKKGQPVFFLSDTAPTDGGSLRSTTLGSGESRIHTVEHLLAALSGLGITNMHIHVDGDEIPVLDGSAAPFVAYLRGLGIEEQKDTVEAYAVQEPIFCHEGTKAIAIYPSDDFTVAYVLQHEHPLLSTQKAEFTVTADIFEREIAPARTFCTEKEGKAAFEKGFGKGANYKNTLVLSEQGLIENEFRFKNECARHKVLDIVGDLAVLGFPVKGRIVGIRSGHRLNHELVRQLQRQREGR